MFGVLTSESISEIFSEILKYEEIPENSNQTSMSNRLIGILSEKEASKLEKYDFVEILNWLKELNESNGTLGIKIGKPIYCNIHDQLLKVRNTRRRLL